MFTALFPAYVQSSNKNVSSVKQERERATKQKQVCSHLTNGVFSFSRNYDACRYVSMITKQFETKCLIVATTNDTTV